jgi:hypothetical protein
VTTWRYWHDWAGVAEWSTGLFQNPASYTGASPYADTDDQDGSYVTFGPDSGGFYTNYVIFRFPAGINVRSLSWQGGTYDASLLPGPPPVQDEFSTSWRMEFVLSHRMAGNEPIFPAGNYTLMGLVGYDGSEWGLPNPFDLYLSDAWTTDWETVYTGRSHNEMIVDLWQERANTGDLGFAVRWSTNPTGPTGTFPQTFPWTVDLSYVALVIPNPRRQPRIRQRQRDDFRTRQRESRQLTTRGRSYI